MSAIRYSLVAALLAVGAGGTTGLALSPGVTGTNGGITCRVTLDQSAHHVTLRATATSATALRGAYALRVDRHGGAGHALIAQDGDVSLRPDQAATLAELQLSGHARDIRAELELHVDQRGIVCHAAAL
jgi:hypothetical protein